MWARLHICHRRPKAGPCRTDRTHRASQAGGDRQGFGPPLAPLQTQTLCLRTGSQRSLSPGGVGPRPQPRGFEPPLLRGARQEGVYPGRAGQRCWAKACLGTGAWGQQQPKARSHRAARVRGQRATKRRGCEGGATPARAVGRPGRGCQDTGRIAALRHGAAPGPARTYWPGRRGARRRAGRGSGRAACCRGCPSSQG